MSEEKADLAKTEAIADYLRLTKAPVRPHGIGITAKEAGTALEMSQRNASRKLKQDEKFAEVKMYDPASDKNLHVFMLKEHAEEHYPEWIVEN